MRGAIAKAAGLFFINIFTALAIQAAAQVAPQDYPQWRGQNRDGSASGFLKPSTWPEQLTLLWKVDVGEGYATPLVVGQTVYTFTRRDGSEVMTALDAKSGVERWRSSYPAPYKPSDAAGKHGAGAKATPLFHEGKLFTLGISGIVSAFDASNGRRLWQTAAPKEHPYFSAASSPVGDRGVVIVHPGNYDPLTAFDAATGTVKWQAGDGGFFASPIIVTLEGTRQVVAVTQKSVIGVSLPDGDVLWRFPWMGASGGPTPVVVDDTIIVSGFGAGTTAFKVARRDGTWVTSPLWETNDVAMYISTPVVIGKTLFGLSHLASGQFFALDTGTGKTLWLGQAREAANTGIAKAADLVFLLNDDGELIVANASRTGFEAVKRYAVADSATWAQPAISGDRIFIKDVSSLAAWTFRH